MYLELFHELRLIRIITKLMLFFSLSYDVIAELHLVLVAVGEHRVSERSRCLQLASHGGFLQLSDESICSFLSSLKKALFYTEKNLPPGHYHLNFLPFPSLQVMTRDPDHFRNCWGVIFPTLRSCCWQLHSGCLLPVLC